MAIARTLASALAGKCSTRPELAAEALPPRARLVVVRCLGGEGMLRRLFEPLGYAVQATDHPVPGRVVVEPQLVVRKSSRPLKG